MTPDFTPLKGVEAAERAAESGSPKFFTPRMTWAEDEAKYILLLTPMSEVYTADLHEFVAVGEGEKANGEKYTQYESFVSRKSLGEATDDIEDRLGRKAKRRSIGVGVELEPILENVKGRPKPTG